jgi:hypothetical protein
MDFMRRYYAGGHGGNIKTPLISGRFLHYTRIYPSKNQFGSDCVVCRPHKGAPFDIYGGIRCQHNTQATARDIFAIFINKVHELKGYRIVLHAHDECNWSVPKDEAEGFVTLLNDLVADTSWRPAWMDGLPLAAEVAIQGRRYRK